MSEHTKEEWKVIPDEDCVNKCQAGKITRRFDIRSGNLLIATIWAEDEFAATRQKTPIQAEQEANVQLIATAPDLLYICEEAFFKLETMTTEEYQQGGDKDIRLLLKQVIKKATLPLR